MSGDTEILVTLSTFGAYSEAPIRRLEQSGFSFQLNPSGRRMTPREVAAAGPRCKGVVAGVERYSDETLSKMPHLKCISRCGAGIDNIDPAAAERLGISVLNTPDEPTAAVAELTLAMMLALLRRMPAVDAQMHSGRWQRVTGNLLAGKTVGLIGLGRIGKRVAELVSAFGAAAMGTDPCPDETWARAHAVELVTLSELLSRADIVANHASGLSGHPLFLDAGTFARMKRGSWFINMARGDMIDDRALNEAVASGHLSGAGLDVYPQEPYSGPLCRNDKVILSPHQATLTVETRNAMELRAVENLIGCLKGVA